MLPKTGWCGTGRAGGRDVNPQDPAPGDYVRWGSGVFKRQEETEQTKVSSLRTGEALA